MDLQPMFIFGLWNKGKLVHAISNGKAICGRIPGRTSVGWQEGKEITCPRCLRIIKSAEATRRPKPMDKYDRTLSQVLESQGISTYRDSQTDTDGRRGWWDKDDNQMGRFDVVEGWAIVDKNGW